MHVIISNNALYGKEILELETQDASGFSFMERYPFKYTDIDEFIGNVSFPIKIKDYDWELFTDYKYTKIPVSVKPITYNYVVQIVANNTNIICDSLYISGLAYKYNVKENTTFPDKCNTKLQLYEKQINTLNNKKKIPIK